MTITLRDTMRSREGHDRAEFQIGRGRRAFAIERESPSQHRTETAIVFGKSPSDAKRAAEAPARLGEGCDGDVIRAAAIVTGWDEPITWPLAPAVTEQNRFIVAFGVLTFQVDATDQQAAKDGAREQFRALLHREPVVGPCVIDWAPLT